ncbi:MAG: molybdopterin molybdotransferase MoeA [Pseudomonadota bacterium]|nr:molybdopterin molybdotransferase MoeA [Pseudomonadota bacterium]
MIPVDEARQIILDGIEPLPLEKVNILEALGRVIGEDVTAPRNLPPKNNSAMDGYAVRAEDTKNATAQTPVVLAITEDIPAGTIPRQELRAGQAARIMTGAPLPAGADAVVRMEDTRKDGGKVYILAAAYAGLDIRMAGEDVAAGETVIARGTVIRPAEVGMLAALGRSFVFVNRRPTVAILATGDELMDIDEAPSEWKIISSNSYSTAAQVLETGGAILQLGIVKDRREDLIAKFQAASRADLIISSGGVSVGDYDLVKGIMQEVGNAMQFWQVAMRPGKPLAYGVIQGVPVFGLPGNPVSSMVSFEQFVRPSLLKMLGRKNIFRRHIRAVLEEDLEKLADLRYFVRGRVRREAGRYYVSSTGEQGSGILNSMVQANGLIVLPEAETMIARGTEVQVQLLDASLEHSDRPD